MRDVDMSGYTSFILRQTNTCNINQMVFMDYEKESKNLCLSKNIKKNGLLKRVAKSCM